MEGKKGVQGPPVKGRGRGRGIVAPRVGVAPGLQEPKEKSVKDLVKELQPSNLKSTVEFLTVRPMTNERHQDLLDKAVEEVCDRMLENTEFVDIGAELLKYLWDAKLPDSVSIRKPLLTRIQTIYRARNNLTETEFQNYAALLCELFGCLTIGDQPLAALTGPVYALLHELLVDRGKYQNNILTFHMLILKHGLLLEKQEKVSENHRMKDFEIILQN